MNLYTKFTMNLYTKFIMNLYTKIQIDVTTTQGQTIVTKKLTEYWMYKQISSVIDFEGHTD